MKKQKIESWNKSTMNKNTEKWQNRVLIGTPTTGNVRMEWVHARYAQIIPTAWSQVEYSQWMSAYMPLEYKLLMLIIYCVKK
jgi:hypothetical protein